MIDPAGPRKRSSAAASGRLRLEELDLSPQGLADAPANQQDSDSIVFIGITD
ncbi:hypothetical protein [Arthrobacter sp. B3I4]|uniref:hypothetical protein n=1 Tax=Arthrobacter sp. B3I4 TaxID=3042267 RepID=UPI00277EB538|nr:hypothetical protein [Arthrobacter sp. B3I4]MDQ0754494.1 hypothetical protein [Arthrobacter sp. B3I4]